MLLRVGLDETTMVVDGLVVGAIHVMVDQLAVAALQIVVDQWAVVLVLD